MRGSRYGRSSISTISPRKHHLEVCSTGASFLHTISPLFNRERPLHYLPFHPIVLPFLHRCRMSKMTVFSPDDSCLQGTASRNSADPERGQALTDPRLVSRPSWPWPTGRSETACPQWGSCSVLFRTALYMWAVCHNRASLSLAAVTCEMLATAGPAARACLHSWD